MLSYSSHEAGGVLVFTVEDHEERRIQHNPREWLYKTIEGREDPRFVIDLADPVHEPAPTSACWSPSSGGVDRYTKGKIVLAHVDPFIHDILKMMRIDKLFGIMPETCLGPQGGLDVTRATPRSRVSSGGRSARRARGRDRR